MKNIWGNFIYSVGSGAMILSMTRVISDEETIKKFLEEQGYQCAVTELGGNLSYTEFKEKITRSVIGACLNCGIIAKISNEVHALLHATEEAKKGIEVNVSASANVSLKVAFVRKDHWIAVAMFGESAVHHVSNHQRAGLGVMHI
ncbi:MAG: anti-terminator HutP [Firmicutes bacterium]|nr:anti-terminator HutP [Bacillota bacterium]